VYYLLLFLVLIKPLRMCVFLSRSCNCHEVEMGWDLIVDLFSLLQYTNEKRIYSKEVGTKCTFTSFFHTLTIPSYAVRGTLALTLSIAPDHSASLE